MRRPKYPTDAELALAEFVGDRNRPKRRRAMSPLKVRTEIDAMIAVNNFDGATASHLVALYEHCHARVYGVRPLELDGEAWLGAASAAAKLVKDEFGGKFTEAVEFVRWTWWREQQREKRARDTGQDKTFRIGWRLQFRARNLLTDYRVEIARQRGR